MNLYRNTLFLLLLALLIAACSERVFMDEGSVVVRFSRDTISFDTVFTAAGTVTRELRVINPGNRWIKFDKITLGGGGGSSFRINIDGMSGVGRDIEVAPGDSIFVFIDLFVDPQGEELPLYLTDSVIFETRSTRNNVFLEAWGQDINLVSDEIIKSAVWSAGKPWVIQNSVVVDTGEVLTVEAGARILFHRNATMYVAGRLIVNGEHDNKVIFSSDRTEPFYRDIPGQWNGIVFLNGSNLNYINNAVIKNGVSAIQLGTLFSDDTPPDLTISNTLIRHMTVAGISSLGGTVEALNCDIGHCGFYALYFALGGDYSFTHCTIANFWEYSSRFTPSVLISDYYDYGNSRFKGVLTGVAFVNSVIAGTLSNEILLFPSDGAINLPCTISDSWLDIDKSDPIWSGYDLSGVLTGKDPLFIDFSGYDFRPDTLSPLVDAAGRAAALLLPVDIRGFNRFEDSGPDIGAYERQPGENNEKKK